ncbi:hypothetical protein NMY22_g4499 [Coprinellus aureogranulatus]|nr:hypothetical protein NMY22_g4499 [Coprinellus aureogranulatus]
MAPRSKPSKKGKNPLLGDIDMAQPMPHARDTTIDASPSQRNASVSSTFATEAAPNPKRRRVEQDVVPQDKATLSAGLGVGNVALKEDEKPKKSQRASVYMDDMMEEFTTILHYILASESSPKIGSPCRCGKGVTTCMCHDCLFYEPSCEDCFVSAHQASPLHWAEVWNGDFFERRDISELSTSFVHTLGHAESGKLCPNADYSKSIEFIIADLNGVHRTRVVFCGCRKSTVRRFHHCLSSCIFPSTVGRPASGFTFSLLRDFHLQTLTSKKSAYDYMEAIRCKGNNAFPQDASDLYPQFLRVQRVWRAAANTKRAGQAHGIDSFFPFRPKGNVSVPCFSCIEPGFNVDLVDGELDISTGFEHLFTLFLMMDGHFGLQRFDKVDDPDDISLLRGAGLFPDDETWKQYEKKIVVRSDEKSTCSNFNAVEMQNKLKFKGCIITGVLGVECRHCVFLSMVDLQKGERFANGDFALAWALRRFVLAAISLQRARYFQRIVVTYDVACQYWVHLKERFANAAEDFPIFDIATVVDAIHMLVPKMHLDGHKEDCRYRYSLNYFDGAGRTHGEGIEPSWAESKQSGGSTQHMNHGHRHDTIIDLHNFWNWLKARGMVESLRANLVYAREMRDEMIQNYLSLSLVKEEETVKGWLKEPTQPYLKDGQWCSPYRLTLRKLPTQDEILKSFEDQETSRAEAVHDGESKRKSKLEKVKEKNRALPSTVIDTGIKLQAQQRALQKLVKDGESEQGQLAKERKSLTAEVRSWRKLYLQSSSSSYHLDLTLDQRQSLGLLDLAIIEIKLREGEANEAVVGICNSLTHENLLTGFQHIHARGVKQNTRSHRIINRIKAKRHAYAASYRHARLKLLSLNNLDPKSELEGFPILNDAHMYQKNAAQARVLGEGTEVDSWIWSYGNLRGLHPKERKAFVNEAAKVHWFRTRADMMRWVEEVEILEQEFRRFITGTEKMAEFWGSVKPSTSVSGEEEGENHFLKDGSTLGHMVYARQKMAMYHRMALDGKIAFLELGGTWPSSGESLAMHVAERRPSLDIDWSKAEEFHAEVVEGDTSRAPEAVMRHVEPDLKRKRKR